MRKLLLTVPMLALAACGGEAPATNEADAAPPATLPAGEWEIASTVESLRSTDNTTPATSLKQGETTTMRVCVAEGEAPSKLFTGSDDQCTTDTAYNRKGRLNIAFQCRREGQGAYSATADGNYTADSLEVAVGTATIFAGTGDYQMNQRLTGKRIGDCPAADPATAQG